MRLDDWEKIQDEVAAFGWAAIESTGRIDKYSTGCTEMLEIEGLGDVQDLWTAGKLKFDGWVMIDVTSTALVFLVSDEVGRRATLRLVEKL